MHEERTHIHGQRAHKSEQRGLGDPGRELDHRSLQDLADAQRYLYGTSQECFDSGRQEFFSHGLDEKTVTLPSGYVVAYQRRLDHNGLSAKITTPEGAVVHYSADLKQPDYLQLGRADVNVGDAHMSLRLMPSEARVADYRGPRDDEQEQAQQKCFDIVHPSLDALRQAVETSFQEIESNVGVEKCNEVMHELEDRLKDLYVFFNTFMPERWPNDLWQEERELLNRLHSQLYQPRDSAPQFEEDRVYYGDDSGKQSPYSIVLETDTTRFTFGTHMNYNSGVSLRRIGDEREAHDISVKFNRKQEARVYSFEGNILETVDADGVHLGNGGQTHREAVANWDRTRQLRESALDKIRITTIAKVRSAIQRGYEAMVGNNPTTEDQSVLEARAMNHPGKAPEQNLVSHDHFAETLQEMSRAAEKLLRGLREQLRIAKEAERNAQFLRDLAK